MRSQDLLPHDDVVVRYCEVLGKAGYHTFVKDHPLQFGFRRRELFERLSKMPSVTCVPYDVPATYLIEKCDVSWSRSPERSDFRRRSAGLCSVVTEAYYADDEHYLHVRNFSEIDGIVDRIGKWRRPADMEGARRQIVRKLVAAGAPETTLPGRNSIPTTRRRGTRTKTLVESFNRYLPRFMKK